MRRVALSLALALSLCVVMPGVHPAYAQQTEPASSLTQLQEVDIDVFARQGCAACARARAYLDDLQRERPGLRIRISDVVEDSAALVRLQTLAQAHGVAAVATPTFLVRGQLLVGWADRDTTGRQIEALLDGATLDGTANVGETCSVDVSCEADASVRNAVTLPVVGRIELARLGLPLFTALVGLLDGFNPCAMWVLVLVLSLLANTRRRATMLMVAGTFVLVSGLIYFTFMAAWLNVFLLVGFTRQIQVVLGGFALVAGVLNTKDFVAFRRGPSLSIPSQAKPNIYRRVNQIVHAERWWLALIGVATLAVLVNTVELLCTAGLPAIYTQVLASQSLTTLQYYAYLAAYQVFYMLDDSVMLAIGVITLSHYRLQEREGRWLKLVSGAVMLGLGGVLLLQPAWLQWTL